MPPVHPFSEPGEPIPLFEGLLRIGGASGPGRIWFRTTGEPDVLWECELDASLPVGAGHLCFDHPLLGPVAADAFVTNSGGRGVVTEARLGDGAVLSSVRTHWLDVPMILPCEPLQEGLAGWAGSWEATAGGWTLRLDSRQDLTAALTAAKDSPHHAVTHVGVLRRADGATFTADAAVMTLEAWQLALSFAFGRWVPPALAWGFDEREQPVWAGWLPWRADGTSGQDGWWDTHTGDDLREATQLLVDGLLDPARRDLLHHLAHHLLAANERHAVLEGRVMLATATVEYLSWATWVLSGRRTREEHSTRDRTAEANLRELLSLAGIPLEVPPELDAVLRFIDDEQSVSDGPSALARIRNRLVHPKDAAEPYRREHLLVQTWQLSMHYGELLLLAEIGYRGRYQPRFPPGRWAHDSEPVPWANAAR